MPRQYQILTLRPDGLTRYLRAYAPDRKTWTGDNRADPVRDRWQADHAMALCSPAALAATEPDTASVSADCDDGVRSRRDPRRREESDPAPTPWTGDPLDRGDLFLAEVATVAGLRHDPAQVRAFPSAEPGTSYLVVTRTDPYGPVETWPVGAVDASVDEKILDLFVERVHRPRRAMDPFLRSHLVYSGSEPAPEVRQLAKREGVQLHSLVEYRGLIDLARVRDRQRELLSRDTRYPSALYVPQRFRRQHPVLERRTDHETARPHQRGEDGPQGSQGEGKGNRAHDHPCIPRMPHVLVGHTCDHLLTSILLHAHEGRKEAIGHHSPATDAIPQGEQG